MLNRVKQKYLKLPFHSFSLFVDILIKKYISLRQYLIEITLSSPRQTGLVALY